MREIVYRIYKVETYKTLPNSSNNFLYGNRLNVSRIELAMDSIICDSKEDFKNIIRDLYGKDIMFAYSKYLEDGDVYCCIIADKLFNKKKSFTRYEYECDCCHTKCCSFLNRPYYLNEFEIHTKLFNQLDKYKDKKFCSERCRDLYLKTEKRNLGSDVEGIDTWVSRGDFRRKVAGFIYKITLKSTGQFYIGKSVYEPMFRWLQHLDSDRFSIDNITDYQYETIEIVPYRKNILEREKYWIQKAYKESPELVLNIAQTKGIEQND